MAYTCPSWFSQVQPNVARQLEFGDADGGSAVHTWIWIDKELSLIVCAYIISYKVTSAPPKK